MYMYIYINITTISALKFSKLEWVYTKDIFGLAVSGQRIDTRQTKTSAHLACIKE